MRWLADECVDAALVSRLRAAGHDVVYMAEVAPAASDSEVIQRARQDNRLLLTEDKDFGDLVFRHGAQTPGVVLLRTDPARHALKAQRLNAAIEGLATAYSANTPLLKRRGFARGRCGICKPPTATSST